jgi:4a-hydroxytetrahydrobiopterin dehydratase
MALADQECIPCRGGVPPMAAAQAEQMLAELDDGWQLNADGHLERPYKFGNFIDALSFANKVAGIAESQSHHPDLHIRWGECRVEIWTHKISGLTESDFYMAAKIDRAWRESIEAQQAR